MENVEIDVNGPQWVSDPTPLHRRLLAEAPVYWSEQSQYWYVSPYALCQQLFINKACSSDRVSKSLSSLPGGITTTLSPLLDSLQRWIVFRDAPEHTKLRKVMNHAFTRHKILALEDDIAALASELLAPVKAGQSWDVISTLAYPLPVLVIADMLGFPKEDREQLKHWSDEIGQFLGRRSNDIELALRANQAVVAANDYFAELIRQQRQQPQDNVLQRLIELVDSDADLAPADLLANCMALVFAGHETTTNLIGNGLLTLLQHPEQWRSLVADAAYIPGAVEECLRFEPPVPRISRVLTEDITVGGQCLQRGQGVIIMVGAAHRDARQFERPDVFDILRKDSKHLALGFGIHNCSGAALARLEAKCAFEALAHYFPTLSLTEYEWSDSLGLRGLTRLLVSAPMAASAL